MSISVNAGYKGWLPNAGFRPLSKVTLVLVELAMNYSALNQDRKGTIHPQIEYTTSVTGIREHHKSSLTLS